MAACESGDGGRVAEFDLPLTVGLRLASALWRARGDHVVRLVDAGWLDGGAVRLVIDDGLVPLGDVLARDLAIGEAITVLVPLAECIDGLAAAGVVHGAISSNAIRLDERGAPLLGGFESARVSDALDEGTDGAPDRIAFRELARVVLAAVDPAEARDALTAGLDVIVPTARGSLIAFAERLLAEAAPVAVRLGLPPRQRDVDPPPARGSDRALGRLRQLAATLRSHLRRVRPRFWVPASIAVLGFVAAAVLLPGGVSGDGGVSAGGLETPSSTAPRPTSTGALPRPTGTGTLPRATGTEALSRPTATPTGAATVQDPVSAALGLRPDARSAIVVDDYGDIVLLKLETAAGAVDILIERTNDGWRLREMLSEEG